MWEVLRYNKLWGAIFYFLATWQTSVGVCVHVCVCVISPCYLPVVAARVPLANNHSFIHTRTVHGTYKLNDFEEVNLTAPFYTRRFFSNNLRMLDWHLAVISCFIDLWLAIECRSDNNSLPVFISPVTFLTVSTLLLHLPHHCKAVNNLIIIIIIYSYQSVHNQQAHRLQVTTKNSWKHLLV